LIRVCETRRVSARLVTIPISHFFEKARWALDRAGVQYVEQPHLRLVHVLAARFSGGGPCRP
jgi:glutathione S-transferase